MTTATVVVAASDLELSAIASDTIVSFSAAVAVAAAVASTFLEAIILAVVGKRTIVGSDRPIAGGVCVCAARVGGARADREHADR